MKFGNSNFTYSIKAPNTNKMHENIHAAIAVGPSDLGVFAATVLKMLTKTRNKVTSRIILPGIALTGIKKDIQLTTTSSPLGR